MKHFALWLMLAAVAGSGSAQEGPTGRDILVMIDENMVMDRAASVATMIVHGRSGSRTIQSRSWIAGQDSAFVEYLSPPREKGKKMLRLGDKLWTYTPEPADRIITISGHLLRQSVMGSDLSYEDFMDNRRLAEMYSAELVGEETFNDRKCWVLELSAVEKDVAYHSRKIWVDTERRLPLKENRYAKRGKLLKTTEILEVFRVEGRWFPKRMTFKDALSRGGGTEYIIESIDLDLEIPNYMFSKGALRQ
jgi:outer membrane lipoprotein-sorting protein